MADQNTVSDINNLIITILAYDPDKLLNNPIWGEVNFSEAKDALTDIQSILRPLANLPLRFIPQGEANTIRDTSKQITQIIQKIEEYRVTIADPSATRLQLISELTSRVEELYKAVSRHAAYLALQSGDLAKVTSDLATQQSEIARLTTEAQKYAESSKLEIDDITRTAREVAGNAGVGHFSSDFSDQAEKQQTAAGYWLLATAGMAVATAALAIVSFFYLINPDATASQIVQIAVSKVVLLGLFVSATVWCGRQYRALQHQISTNNHRANALKTFQAFVQAAADDSSKDAVLMETTRSIFAITPSGYLGSGDSSSSEGIKIVELIRGAGTVVDQ